MAFNTVLGARGEQLAAAHLEASGMEILDRNWRCRHGELDIVAADDGELVFVEVKTRSSAAYGHPFEAITATKIARLRLLAGIWCQAHEVRARLRIDAVAVLAPRSGTVSVEHMRGVG